MKKKSGLLLIPVLGLLISCSSAQKADKTSDSVHVDPALNTQNSLLWQIYGNGLKQPSYLYGTIHAIPDDDYFLGKNVAKKLKSSGQLILEVDLNKIDMEKLTSLSLLPDGKYTKDYLSDTDYAVLLHFMEDSIGMKKYTFEKAYARFKPFYLEQFLYFKELGEARTSYEDEFMKMAEEKSMPVKGLETMEEQLAFIDTIPIDMQFRNLVSTLRNYNEEAADFRQLIIDYKNQNLPAFEKAMESEQDKETAFFTDLLINHRNATWVPKLDLWMHDMPCFIAVGAGHLFGQKGLIQLLRNKGYTVEPISIN